MAASKPRPGLYLVATPIGHLEDITLRALSVLRAADLIACEDTRVFARLAGRYGVTAPTTAYHDHNGARMRPRLLAALAEGKVVALVSDAGTPLIADPGYRLVREAVAAGHPVTALPGASAVLTALSLSGLPSDRFLFAGFLPDKGAARRRAIRELAAVPATLVIYEAPQRAAACLADLAELLGPRPAALARELTKLYEEVRRDDLPALAAFYAEHGPPRGEVVLVIGPPDADAAPAGDSLDTALRAALAAQPFKIAVADVAARLGLPRRQVYARALQLRDAPADTAGEDAP